MPGGRPTDYRPELCDEVREWGKKGKSLAQISGELDIGITTINRWIEEWPEFRKAIEDARTFSEKWWEDIGMQYMVEKRDGTKLNNAVWMKSMTARFSKNYRDNKPEQQAATVIVQQPTLPPDVIEALAYLEAKKKQSAEK